MPPIVRRARRDVHRFMKPFLRDLRILRGKRVWEVLPRALPGKGETLKNLLKDMPKTTLQIYVGDDSTDETAFDALRKGITVRVGRSSQTQAQFWVRNPDDVFRFLRKAEETLCCR